MGDSQSRLDTVGVLVETLTIPTLLRQHLNFFPTLIKVDVEGHETRILPDVLALRAPTYISWHEPWWDAPVSDVERRSWFDAFTLEAIRGDGWTGFSELLAVPTP